jgi:hypothetical protein
MACMNSVFLCSRLSIRRSLILLGGNPVRREKIPEHGRAIGALSKAKCTTFEEYSMMYLFMAVKGGKTYTYPCRVNRGKRKIYYVSNCLLLRRGTSAVNRRITHFHRRKSRQAGKNPAGVLSQNYWSVPKLRHGLGLLGRKRHGPDMLPIIRRGEIAIFRRQLIISTTDPSLSKGKVKGM